MLEKCFNVSNHNKTIIWYGDLGYCMFISCYMLYVFPLLEYSNKTFFTYFNISVKKTYYKWFDAYTDNSFYLECLCRCLWKKLIFLCLNYLKKFFTFPLLFQNLPFYELLLIKKDISGLIFYIKRRIVSPLYVLHVLFLFM